MRLGDRRAEPRPGWLSHTKAYHLLAAAEREPRNVDAWAALAEQRQLEGNLLPAVDAWERALSCDPDRPDAYAGIAHALRHIDPARSAEAARAADREEASDDLNMAAGAAAAGGAVWLDLTDLIDYVRVNTTLSGIQRVVANLLRCCWRQPERFPDVRCVVPDFRNHQLFEVGFGSIIELIDTIEHSKPTREHLDRLLRVTLDGLRSVRAHPGDTFLMTGAFWISHNYDLLKTLRMQDVTVSVFIHDLIQINNPGYVQPAATNVFRRSLIDVLELVNFVTTNSEFVASEVRRFCREQLQLDRIVVPVPLATEMSLPANLDPLRAMPGKIGASGYVLCVCTIEIRKNHVYLTDIWERMLVSGRTDVPTLVLVGKWGWEIDDFRRHLAATDNLGGCVQVLSNVSDAELAQLYSEARFTIYPSFAEGWGLPVGESLAFGTPCVASGVTAIPEVGGGLVRYVDPLDVESGLRVVTHLLDHPEELERWRRQIQTDFQPRGWDAFADRLLAVTRTLASRCGRDTPNAFARIAPGEMAILGGDCVIRASARGDGLRTARMARVDGWHHLEHDGAWMKSPRASLFFSAVDCAPGQRLQVTLELAGTGRPMQVVLETSTGETNATWVTDVAGRRLSCPCTVDEHGNVAVTIVVVKGNPVRFADRDNYLRLSRVGYVRDDHEEDRLALLEAVLLPA